MALKDEVTTYRFNFAQWAEENHAVTGVTWTSKHGSAAISGAALAANVASAQITFGSAGSNLIRIVAASSTETKVIYLDVVAKDPNSPVDDYGMCA